MAASLAVVGSTLGFDGLAKPLSIVFLLVVVLDRWFGFADKIRFFFRNHNSKDEKTSILRALQQQYFRFSRGKNFPWPSSAAVDQALLFLSSALLDQGLPSFRAQCRSYAEGVEGVEGDPGGFSQLLTGLWERVNEVSSSTLGEYFRSLLLLLLLLL